MIAQEVSGLDSQEPLVIGVIFVGAPHNDNFPAWSPKGDRIAFTTDRDGDYEIYSIRPDGSDLGDSHAAAATMRT